MNPLFGINMRGATLVEVAMSFAITSLICIWLLRIGVAAGLSSRLDTGMEKLGMPLWLRCYIYPDFCLFFG